ncbi:hypothetical protein ACEPAI_3620 [Sanghuangporus weigelae]
MSLNSPLPPPIRDPSGKIYIAIPAPPFVLAQDASVPSQIANSAPGYIYVEYHSSAPYELPRDLNSLERSELVDDSSSLSVHNWMVCLIDFWIQTSTNYDFKAMSCSAYPPPDHIPWTGHVPLSSSASTLSTLMDDHSNTNAQGGNLASSSLKSSSVATLDIPSADSGNTLLSGSLPSTCSSAWSGGILVPPISEAKSTARAPRVKSVPASRMRKPDSFVKPRYGPDRRRYTVCTTATSKRREAQIFNRRRTLEKTQDLQPPLFKSRRSLSKSRIMSQIDDLDGFFSEGLKKMDLTMRRFHEEQSKISPPSLVVSTSFAIGPVSLASCDDLAAPTLSLAERRGKVAPGVLKLDNCCDLAPSTIDYPDVPTAFRVSLEPTSDAFFQPQTYPPVKLDPKMTTEQMISNLREQVESFYPRCRDSGKISNMFNTQCKDAWKWLEDELDLSPCENAPLFGAYRLDHQLKGNRLVVPEPLRDDDISSIPYMFPLPPIEVKKNEHIKEPKNSSLRERALSLHASVIRLSTGSLKDLITKAHTPKSKPRKSILSTGPSSSYGSAKKVRFSDTPPSVIPPDGNTPKANSTPMAPPSRLPMSPPKRKPVPSFQPTSTRNSIPLTPIRSSVVRKSSPLNPGSQSRMTTPSARFVSKYAGPSHDTSIQVSSMPPRKGPLIFNSANIPSPGVSADKRNPAKKPSRPMSLGANLKENRDRSLSDKFASIAKRRSYSGGGSDANKDNQCNSKLVELVAQEAQKKGGRRGLPFQNVLNRLRG